MKQIKSFMLMCGYALMFGGALALMLTGGLFMVCKQTFEKLTGEHEKFSQLRVGDVVQYKSKPWIIHRVKDVEYGLYIFEFAVHAPGRENLFLSIDTDDPYYKSRKWRRIPTHEVEEEIERVRMKYY